MATFGLMSDQIAYKVILEVAVPYGRHLDVEIFKKIQALLPYVCVFRPPELGDLTPRELEDLKREFSRCPEMKVSDSVREYFKVESKKTVT